MSDGKLDIFDVSSLNGNDQREALVFLAKTAEAADRFDDMAQVMKKLVIWGSENGVDLSTEERNLLSVAYKNVIGFRRSAWRSLNEPVTEVGESDDKYTDLVLSFRGKVEKELDEICSEVIDLLQNYLVKNADKNKAEEESKVFYLKMLGDYWRYRAESASDSTSYNTSAQQSYEQAMELAEAHLEATHPIRLGLALNYSVCYYEILNKPAKACDLARSAFDLAISKLDRLKEEDYKDSTLIMQLLRDNLTLWQSDQREGDNQEVQLEDVDEDGREFN